MADAWYKQLVTAIVHSKPLGYLCFFFFLREAHSGNIPGTARNNTSKLITHDLNGDFSGLEEMNDTCGKTTHMGTNE